MATFEKTTRIHFVLAFLFKFVPVRLKIKFKKAPICTGKTKNWTILVVLVMQLFYFGESSNIYTAILKRHKIEGKADRTAAKCNG